MSAGKTTKVLFASSEIAPFAKTGGLADVCEALPKALLPLGVTPTLCLPLYRIVKEGGWDLEVVIEDLPVQVGDDEIQADIHRGWLTKEIPVFFVQRDEFFDRTSLYGTPKGDYFDNAQRFAFFSYAVFALSKTLDQRWDVIHCHDWQTALIPVYLKTVLSDDPLFAKTKTILTIHNLGYQGIFPAETFPRLGLPSQLFSVEGLEFWGKVNFLKGGIDFADQVTTVSPTYAGEIQTPEFGNGLEGVLKTKASSLIGILDGVDYSVWSPENDPHLAAHYSSDDLSGKRACKEDLLKRCQLSHDLLERPLLGMVSRLAGQKGVDIICEVVDKVMAAGAGLVILGSGEKRYERLLVQMARKYPQQMIVRIAFDESLAHQIEAGCDIYLMPSLYEPCGLNQMYSLRYGTLPVVRRTGGLADTVVEVNPKKRKGTGFQFIDYHPDALWKAIDKAVQCFANRELWQQLIQQAMAQDFSWSRSAGEYLRLYQRLTKRG
ncbi:MAG: starch synthase [Deltaproteobacteria bacterium RBG_13_52_11]|nr:MAG: starch synthase [Deltaproteobacteria bacterium RBG_13_52_11]